MTHPSVQCCQRTCSGMNQSCGVCVIKQVIDSICLSQPHLMTRTLLINLSSHKLSFLLTHAVHKVLHHFQLNCVREEIMKGNVAKGRVMMCRRK